MDDHESLNTKNKEINDMNVSEFKTYYKALCDAADIDTTDEHLVSTVVIKFLNDLEVYEKAFTHTCGILSGYERKFYPSTCLSQEAIEYVILKRAREEKNDSL